MTEVHESDQKLIADIQDLLDRLAKIRRRLTSKGFALKGNGCVCEGQALCPHHAGVYKRLELAADALALAIGEAGRVE